MASIASTIPRSKILFMDAILCSRALIVTSCDTPDGPSTLDSFTMPR